MCGECVSDGVNIVIKGDFQESSVSEEWLLCKTCILYLYLRQRTSRPDSCSPATRSFKEKRVSCFYLYTGILKLTEKLDGF